jgi:peroxin-3
MGLSEFVDETTSLLPNPGSFLPTAVTRHLPSWLAPSPSGSMERTDVVADAAAVEAEEEERRAEDERNYLTYSWWLLHEGWKGVGQRVEDEVERVFGT